MSDSASSRRPKAPPSNPRAPLFEARHQPLPPQPQPLKNLRDPFEDPPEVRPRAARSPNTIPSRPLPTPRLIGDEEQRLPPAARSPLAEATADMHRAQLLSGRVYDARPFQPLPGPRRSIFGLFQEYPWLIILVGVACLVIIWLASAPSRTFISRYAAPGGAVTVAKSQAPAPNGEHSLLLQGRPTLNADDINAVLAKYGSPAVGTGALWVELGQRYGIDPAYALAFFIHESTAGTNPGWAGLKPDGSTTHNIGNIICAGYPTCFGRFRDYSSWDESIEDWYKLISKEYINDRHIQTIEQIIPVYAPASDNNNVSAYIRSVVTMVDGWRQQGVSR